MELLLLNETFGGTGERRDAALRSGTNNLFGTFLFIQTGATRSIIKTLGAFFFRPAVNIPSALRTLRGAYYFCCAESVRVVRALFVGHGLFTFRTTHRPCIQLRV
jgi:hypothetical protein